VPGKRRLVRLTYRPLNLETPLADLRAAFTPNDAFFVRYHLSVVPPVDARAWRLEVGGASALRPRAFSLAELRREFAPVTVAAVNQCSGFRRGLFAPRVPGVQWENGAIGQARWSGVRLKDVLERVGVGPDALEVVLDGADSAPLPQTPDFVKSLPIAKALEADPLIAFEMNGEPLPVTNGAPARLIVPGWTGTYWMKHLTRLAIEPTRFDGFWMKTAYRVPTGKFPNVKFASQENADTTPVTDILVNSLVTNPLNGAKLRRGAPVVIEGWAWDGGSGIERVEISLDDGASWLAAQLGTDYGRFAWRGFRHVHEHPASGTLRFAVRATSRAGSSQPEGVTPNASGYYHNAIPRIAVEVA
jgi:DMSO/TMAO reductase YedYZ molybdopterin-dependent catalytic subunit